MSDDRLRAAGRRYRETGSLEDEAAWLTLRLRSGALPLEVLELAGYADHPAACAVLAREAPYPRATALNRDLVALADSRRSHLREQLERWPRRLALGFALALLGAYWEQAPDLEEQRWWGLLWEAVQGMTPELEGQLLAHEQGAAASWSLLEETLHTSRALRLGQRERLCPGLVMTCQRVTQRVGTVEPRRAALRWALHLLEAPDSTQRPDRVR